MAPPRWRVAVMAVLIPLTACTQSPAAPPVATVDTEAVLAESTPPPEDMVNLTLYFRRGRGRRADLTPVIREVPVSRARPRQALEMMLAGPGEQDPPRLYPALPRSTKIVHFARRGGIARVTLSHHAVSDAHRLGRRPDHEALALAAVANTLTEFPDIRRVKLRVEGPSGRKFWGFWGLPVTLLRDTAVIDTPPGLAVVPPFKEFSHRRQHVGVRHGRDQPAISAVRAQSFASYTRLTVEVTGGDGAPLSGPVPPSIARRLSRGRLVLRVLGKPSAAVAGSLYRKLDDPAFAGARVDVLGKPHRVVVTMRPRQRTDFWLHALSEPARVVLDIQR